METIAVSINEIIGYLIEVLVEQCGAKIVGTQDTLSKDRNNLLYFRLD